MTMNNKRDKLNSWIAQCQCILGEVKRLKAAAGRLEDDLLVLREALCRDADIISVELEGDRWKAIERNHK